MDYPEKVQGIVAIPDPTAEVLTDRQLIAYRSFRENYLEWLRTEGKNPKEIKGYALDTAKNYASINDKFHRWAWEQHDGFTMELTHEDADGYLKEAMKDDYSGSHLHNIKLALQVYFRYQDDEWETELEVSNSSTAAQPKDFVSKEERSKIREAALEYGSIPSYAALEPEERAEWKCYLARRFGKPMDEVGPDDWDRANGYKYVSLVYASLDAGLRPIEVARARTYWVDHENQVLRIPAKDSSKNIDNWTVTLRSDTCDFLALWMEERELYEKYEDTDRLWLTRHGNPYRGSALKLLLDNLRDIADIEREFSWYAIRHSTGTYMARQEGLAAAQKQLRHHKEKTTMKYDQTPEDDLRDALDKMG